MTFDLEANSMYTFKMIGYYWIRENTVGKYPKLVQLLSQFSTVSKFVNGGIWVQLNVLQSKQRT